MELYYIFLDVWSFKKASQNSEWVPSFIICNQEKWIDLKDLPAPNLKL